MTLHNKKSNIAALYFNRKIFHGILAVFLLTIFVYIYFVVQIVFNIVERKDVENEMKFSQSRIAQMELVYFDSSKSINLESALLQGLKEPTKVGYTTRKTTARNDLKSNDSIKDRLVLN